MQFLYSFFHKHRFPIIQLSLCCMFLFSFSWQCFTRGYLDIGLDVILSKPNSTNTDSMATKRIALTFDDGPGKYTEKLLDGLKARNVCATFFIIGKCGEEHPEILQRMANDGHIIGNHTYSHVNLGNLTISQASEEITKTNTIIYDATGKEVCYIRPPYGKYNHKLKKETNLTKVLWTIDPRDWSVLNTDQVVEHVVKRAKDGDIILLHDIFDTSVEAAFQIIDELTARGFIFVTVEQLDEAST